MLGSSLASTRKGVQPHCDFNSNWISCDICHKLRTTKRLRMEACAEQAVVDLQNDVETECSELEKKTLDAELTRAKLVLEELRKHREHTLFFKVVASVPRRRGDNILDGTVEFEGSHFVSIFDGRTPYRIGVTSVASASGGRFVYSCLDDAEMSAAAFPRCSANLGSERVVLAVRGEGNWRFRHGKVNFDAITPLFVVAPSRSLRSSWRN